MMFLPKPFETAPFPLQDVNENSDSFSSLDDLQNKVCNDIKPKKIADSHDFQVKYKTEICRYWLEHGFCQYGENCAFAHGIEEIRRKPFLPNNYKTKKCKNFHENGYCPYGFRCQFLHNLPKNMTSVKCSVSYFHIFENPKNYIDENLTTFPNKKIQKKRLPTLKGITESKKIYERMNKNHIGCHSNASNFIVI